MATNNRFDPILDKVWKNVKGRNKGVLYTIIFSLIPDQSEAILICRDFGIEKSNLLNEDIKTLHRIKHLNKMPMKYAIDLIAVGTAVTTGIGSRVNASDKNNTTNLIEIQSLPENNSSNLTDKASYFLGIKITNDLIVQFVIGIGLIVVGLYLWNLYRNQSNPSSIAPQPTEIYTSKADAFICLVVPTNRIDPLLHNLILPDKELTVEQTQHLIDKSVYFIACAEKDLHKYVDELNFGKQIDYAEQGDIYIKLFLPAGADSINRKTKGGLSRNVLTNAIVKEIYLLRNLDNIARFHRA